MKPSDRFPEPRVPTRTMVAFRAKFLETWGLEGVAHLEGVERPESSFAALGRRLSACRLVAEKFSFVIAIAKASLETEALRELATNDWGKCNPPQLWRGLDHPTPSWVELDLDSCRPSEATENSSACFMKDAFRVEGSGFDDIDFVKAVHYYGWPAA